MPCKNNLGMEYIIVLPVDGRLTTRFLRTSAFLDLDVLQVILIIPHIIYLLLLGQETAGGSACTLYCTFYEKKKRKNVTRGSEGYF